MNSILDVIKRAILPAGVLLALSSGVAHADVSPASYRPFMNHQWISEQPWIESKKEQAAQGSTAMRPLGGRGTGMNPFSRDSYLVVLIGPGIDELARRNPYVIYASILFLPDALRSRASRALLFKAGTELPPSAPAPVPLPAPLVLMLSGLGVVLGLRARHRAEPPAVPATA